MAYKFYLIPIFFLLLVSQQIGLGQSCSSNGYQALGSRTDKNNVTVFLEGINPSSIRICLTNSSSKLVVVNDVKITNWIGRTYFRDSKVSGSFFIKSGDCECWEAVSVSSEYNGKTDVIRPTFSFPFNYINYSISGLNNIPAPSENWPFNKQVKW